MPYIITTRKHWHGPAAYYADTRRAVATIEEAREATQDVMLDRSSLTTWPEGSNAANWRAASDLPEAGGTVGPLPDGTVIEVALVTYRELACRADVPHTDNGLTTAYIDAYNAVACHA